MDLDAYLQQMLAGPDPAAKKAALAQALAASGLATLGGRNGGGWQGAMRSAGQGGLLGMGAYDQAMQDASRAPAQNLDMIGKVMGLKAQQQQMEDRDAAKQSNAAFAQQLGGVFAPPGPQYGNMGAGGPTPENAQRVAPPQTSPQDRIAQYRRVADMYTQRGDAENAKKFDDIADRMQEEYSTTPQIVMQGGKPTLMQFGKRGTTRAADGMEPPPDTQMLNLGGRMQAVDKRTVAPGATFDVTMDPAQRDASNRGWADINDRRAREKAEGAGGAAVGKVPTGYRWKADGTLEAIPGGPNDTSGKDQVRAEGAVARADHVISAVDKAIEQGRGMSTGLPGAALGQIPGTPAYDLRRTVDTIKANIGFQELQAMREASPTGGALGQVAVQELNMLQSVLSSVDANQSTDQLQASLAKVKKHFENWKGVMKRAQGQTAGASGGWSITPVSK